ncbi:MAG: DUF4139 domain-containing protein [Phycisphaerae bacterium]
MRLAPLLACVLLTGAVFAQPKPAEPKNVPRGPVADDAPANANSKYSLTIYSTDAGGDFDPSRPATDAEGNRRMLPGFAVVREVRRIELQAGQNVVKFTDVAADIDPTTVALKSLTAPGSTRVLEQNYEYDLVSPDKLLAKYVGRSIIINRKQTPLAADLTRIPDTIEGKLLAFTPDQFVLQTNNKQLPVQIIPRNADIQEVKFFELQTGLMTRPTLVWKVETDRAGAHDVLVTYQTAGITWRADYGLTLSKDEKTAELSAWVSAVNESGASFPEARVKLIAGDVQRLEQEQAGRGLFGGSDDDGGMRQRPFFEYHLYSLGRATTLPNNATKQIELFPNKANVPVTREYEFDGAGRIFNGYRSTPRTDDRAPAGNTKVDVYLKLANTEKAGLGLPLPAGRVRVYKLDDADPTDPAGSQEFVGEDATEHTPRDETVRVRVGSAFDLVGERKRTGFKYDENGKTIAETFEVVVRNHKKEAVRVAVRETLHRWHNWTIEAEDKYERKGASAVEFGVDVPAGGEKRVGYTVKYSW